MEDRIRIKIESTLSTFSPGLLQDALNLSTVLDVNGLSFRDIDDYLGFRRDEILRHEKLFRRHCPECQGQMDLAPVNTGAGDRTGDRSKSVWTCNECLEQIFNTYSIQERAKERT